MPPPGAHSYQVKSKKSASSRVVSLRRMTMDRAVIVVGRKTLKMSVLDVTLSLVTQNPSSLGEVFI